MSLWNDTFTIKITVMINPYQNRKEEFVITHVGSLKSAIRHVLNKDFGVKGNVTAVFYNSKGEYIKEIGF